MELAKETWKFNAWWQFFYSAVLYGWHWCALKAGVQEEVQEGREYTGRGKERGRYEGGLRVGLRLEIRTRSASNSKPAVSARNLIQNVWSFRLTSKNDC